MHGVTPRREGQGEFGVTAAGEIAGPKGNSYYARIEQRHPILAGFGRNCLLARRPLEKGVRFVTLMLTVTKYPAENRAISFSVATLGNAP